MPALRSIGTTGPDDIYKPSASTVSAACNSAQRSALASTCVTVQPAPGKPTGMDWVTSNCADMMYRISASASGATVFEQTRRRLPDRHGTRRCDALNPQSPFESAPCTMILPKPSDLLRGWRDSRPAVLRAISR